MNKWNFHMKKNYIYFNSFKGNGISRKLTILWVKFSISLSPFWLFPIEFFLFFGGSKHQTKFSICTAVSNLTVQISILAVNSNTESAPFWIPIYLLNIMKRKFPFPFPLCQYYAAFDICVRYNIHFPSRNADVRKT